MLINEQKVSMKTNDFILNFFIGIGSVEECLVEHKVMELNLVPREENQLT